MSRLERPIERKPNEIVVALAGNPNVGKSTLFNNLTHLRQHTGNWPGKTVGSAWGRCECGGRKFLLIDTPGAYSLVARSADEEAAREAILHGGADAVVVVCDATCLERNLNLVLQILEITPRVVVCANLLDEARKKRIDVDLKALSRELGVPVVGCTARSGRGTREILRKAAEMAEAEDAPPAEPQPVDALFRRAEEIVAICVRERAGHDERQARWDRILTSRLTGVPIMLLLLAAVFYLTIAGANVPSAALSRLFAAAEGRLAGLMAPGWLRDLLLEGVFRVFGWVVSVMLPPMAIFFPLFTLLEDLGYLPRVAFNLDRQFQRCHACGKQCLTMCLGFGCNAAGVVGCRIIDSPRERLIAILTNCFVPCNGRFPMLIALISIFFAGQNSLLSAALLSGLIVLGILATFAASRLLSSTVLRGLPSSFTLELPPFRRPRVGAVIVRSVLDRTLHILARAAAVAAPAGAVIWLLANVQIGGATALAGLVRALDGPARFLGLDGAILAAFVLGFPANEIVLPIAMMVYLATGALADVESLAQLRALLAANGWTWLTALSTMLFSLMHWPCSTTVLTIARETKSAKWTLVSVLLPTAFGAALCALTAMLARLMGLV